jgi:hypothetical protein
VSFFENICQEKRYRSELEQFSGASARDFEGGLIVEKQELRIWNSSRVGVTISSWQEISSGGVFSFLFFSLLRIFPR